MQRREVDLNEIATNLAKMLQRIIGEDVRLQLHLHPTPLITHADPGMLDQVLLPIHAGVSSDRVPVAERAKPRGGTESVLLVEDDPEVRMVMREVLGSHGYKVLEAADGVEAVEIWREQGGAVALLLTDLVMPGGLSGLELAGRLRADQRGLKVILSSGYSAEIAGRELQLSEGEHFLQKPFTPRELLEAVRRSLDS